MTTKKHSSIAAFILIVVLTANLLNVRVAFADGETPTEPPVATQVETEQPTELAVESTPVPVEETATPVPAASEAAEASPEAVVPESTPVAGILSDVPEDTSIVVLDEAGQPVALGTQETADAVVNSDPIWCPAGVTPPTPGANGCSASFPSITDLLTAMRTDPTSFDQDGTIFLEVLASPGFTTPLILDDSPTSLDGSFGTLSVFNLTVKGGWNPGAGTVTGAQSLFGVSGGNQGYILIGSLANPWVGNVTLRDVEVRDVSAASSIAVYTSSGDILLDDADVAQQTGDKYLAYLHSISGDIMVGNGSNFDGNDAGVGINESQGFYAETGGSITVDGTGNSQYTFRDNEGTDPDAHNGATLIAPTVTLTNVISRANDGNGIEIKNANAVTLNNVVSSLNQVGGAGNGLSGVLVLGTGSTAVNVYGGTYAKNGRYGIEVLNGSIIIHTPPTCPTTGATANGLGCYNITPTTPGSDSTPPVITPNISGTLGSNGWYTNTVTVTWSVVDNESTVSSNSGCGLTTISADTAGTTLTCTATSTGGTSSNSVTIKRDATAPAGVSGAPNRAPDSGSVYNHAVDIVFSGSDATSGIASCTTVTYSGPNGNGITVNGSCSDNAGNSAGGVSSAFNYDDGSNVTPTAPTPTSTAPASGGSSSGSGSSSSDSSGGQSSPSLVVPPTGGQLIDLDCNSVLTVFGVKLSFLNLCDQQTKIESVSANELPGALPDGTSFVMGLNVSVLTNGQSVTSLPDGTGIQIDFPAATGEFAVLYWDESKGEWIEVTQEIAQDKVSDALSGDAGLFHLTGSAAGFYPVLTTDKPGIFVLVKK